MLCSSLRVATRCAHTHKTQMSLTKLVAAPLALQRTLRTSAPLLGKPPHPRALEEMNKRWPGKANRSSSFVLAERWRQRHLPAAEKRAADHAAYKAAEAAKRALAAQARTEIQAILLEHYPKRVPIADLGAILKWPDVYKKTLKGLRKFVPAHAVGDATAHNAI